MKQSVSIQERMLVTQGSTLEVGEALGGRQLTCVEKTVKQSSEMQDTELTRQGSTLGDGEGDGETGGDVITGGLEAAVPHDESVWYWVKQIESLQSTKLVTHGLTLDGPTETGGDDETGGSVITGGFEDVVPPQGESVSYCVKQIESLHSTILVTHGSTLGEGSIEGGGVVGTGEVMIGVFEVAAQGSV